MPAKNKKPVSPSPKGIIISEKLAMKLIVGQETY